MHISKRKYASDRERNGHSMNKVSITINSRHYTVMAEESEEYIRSLCDHINEKVAIVLGSGANVMGERPIVLAALNVCDEYFKVKEAGHTIGEQISRYTKKIEEEQAKNKRLQRRIDELEAAADTDSEQVSFDENELAVSELKEELEKAKNRIKYLESKLGFGFTQNGKN